MQYYRFLLSKQDKGDPDKRLLSLPVMRMAGKHSTKHLRTEVFFRTSRIENPVKNHFTTLPKASTFDSKHTAAQSNHQCGTSPTQKVTGH